MAVLLSLQVYPPIRLYSLLMHYFLSLKNICFSIFSLLTQGIIILLHNSLGNHKLLSWLKTLLSLPQDKSSNVFPWLVSEKMYHKIT